MHEWGLAESAANNKPTLTKRTLNNKLCIFKPSDPRVFNSEAYSQNPKDDSCDGVDCGLEC